MADKRVSNTPSPARRRALSAAASVKVTGSATGIEASSALSSSGMTRSNGKASECA